MLTLFWLEESSKGSFELFQLERNPGLNQPHANVAFYNPSEDWPTRQPVGLYFNYLVDDFLHEWLIRQEEYVSKEKTGLACYLRRPRKD